MSDDSAGHGTGYEDAIARRIAALEASAREAEAKASRAAATLDELVKDNAALRVRTGEAEARTRRLGALVVVAALVALAVLGAATWLLATRGR